MKASPTLRTASALLAAVSALAGAGCKPEKDAADAPLGAQQLTIVLTTPPSVPVTAVALGANGGLVVGRGAQLRAPATAIPVATNMGGRGVAAEPDATVGDIWSASRVELKDRTRVMGSVHAADVASGANVVMAGTVDRAPRLTPPRTISWNVSYAAAAGAMPSVAAGQTVAVAPGQYVTGRIPSDATLTLRSGSYLFDSLSFDRGARLRLNQGDGPVYVYVRANLRFEGVVESASGASPDLVLVYLGTSGTTIMSPFTGTFVATQAKVAVQSPAPGFTGALFAPDIAIGEGVTVTFSPPYGVLKAAGVPLGQCLQMMVPRGDAQGRPAEIQYQEDILRTCTGGGLTGCETTLYARANADYLAAAQAVIHGRMTPATYLAFVRDRQDKIDALRDDEQAACAVVADDPDGDFVTTRADACPATPDLTPTLANGCTQTDLPPGPTAAQVQRHLGYFGISTDPRCANAPAPAAPAPLGAWRQADESYGKAIWISRWLDTSGCPVWYELEADLTDGHNRHISVQPSEDTTLSWIAKPATAVQIHIRASDGGDRGAWASYAVRTVRYRARALSGSGRRSDWSEWFSPGREDCVPGYSCVD